MSSVTFPNWASLLSRLMAPPVKRFFIQWCTAGHAEWISLVPEVDQTLSGKANLESWKCDSGVELAAVPGRWTRILLGQITATAHFSTCLFCLCCSTQVKKPLLKLLSSRRWCQILLSFVLLIFRLGIHRADHEVMSKFLHAKKARWTSSFQLHGS